MNTTLPVSRLDVNLICRHIDGGLTKYTPVQIYMAFDEWTAAHNEYAAAQVAAGTIDQAIWEKVGNDWAWQIVAHRDYPEYAKFDDATSAAAKNIIDRCPLLSKMRNHSNEAFPVDKTLKIAAQLRNATKKINKAIDAYNKATTVNVVAEKPAISASKNGAWWPSFYPKYAVDLRDNLRAMNAELLAEKAGN